MTGSANDGYETRWAIDPSSAAAMDTAALRRNFLIERLFVPGEVALTYSHYDRMVVGGAMPAGDAPLPLHPIRPIGTEAFLQRRELLVVNIGGEGSVEADGRTFVLANRDMLYLGMGTQDVQFRARAGTVPKFYLLSAPAHQSHAATLLTMQGAKRLELGASETSNKRSIFQYIHSEAEVRTCQLVAGITIFSPGSIWNTMPPHVHDRRMEAYLYFDLPETGRVFHMMGEPNETRHIVVANEQAVLSPAWSIHAGVGTASYAFVWGMAGDNVDYTDVDPVAVADLT
ncbi:MAG TPA: 5-dehydro-4-deoxy-D-glucuronate isomerase [Devosia sp.]|nr:5-dehydro-4-deoxy-D-glucuronate isomerase [Devosia sp.]